MKSRTFLFTVMGLIGVEVASYVAWQHPTFGVFAWVLLVLLTYGLTLAQPELGVAVVMAELVLGGKGYLFVLPLGAEVSIRLGVFLAVLAAWSMHASRNRTFWGGQWRFRWLWLGFWLAAVWATVIGLAGGHGVGVVFNDVNAYFFLALVPTFGLLKTKAHFSTVLYVVAAATVVLALKTALVQGLFVHYPSTSLTMLYKWSAIQVLVKLRTLLDDYIGYSSRATCTAYLLSSPALAWPWQTGDGSGAGQLLLALARTSWSLASRGASGSVVS